MRSHDWETNLADYLSSVDVALLGDAPCAQFVCGAVYAQTGIDLHAPYDGKYDGAISAAKVLKKIGAGNLESTFDRHFERRQGPAFAQRGDVVFNGEAVGICIGRVAIFVADGGLTEIPRSYWTAAWATESAHE